MNTYVKAVLYAYPFLKTVEEDYEEHIKYICENPLRWHYDELYAEE